LNIKQPFDRSLVETAVWLISVRTKQTFVNRDGSAIGVEVSPGAAGGGGGRRRSGQSSSLGATIVESWARRRLNRGMPLADARRRRRRRGRGSLSFSLGGGWAGARWRCAVLSLHAKTLGVKAFIFLFV